MAHFTFCSQLLFPYLLLIINYYSKHKMFFFKKIYIQYIYFMYSTVYTVYVQYTLYIQWIGLCALLVSYFAF